MSNAFVTIRLCYVYNQWYGISCATLYIFEIRFNIVLPFLSPSSLFISDLQTKILYAHPIFSRWCKFCPHPPRFDSYNTNVYQDSITYTTTQFAQFLQFCLIANTEESPCRGTATGRTFLVVGWEVPYYRGTCKKKKERKKATPLQAWTGSESSRRLRLPDFKTISTWRW